MKKLFTTLLLLFVYNVNATEVKPAEVKDVKAVEVKPVELKEVCHDRITKEGKPVLDKKTGKTAQDCKKIKVHQKLEGTAVPEKAPKK
jgi:hypothetical protein